MKLSTITTIIVAVVAMAIAVWHTATHHNHPLPAMREFLSIYTAAVVKMAVIGLVSLAIGGSFVVVGLVIYMLATRSPRRRRPRRIGRAA